MGERSRIGYRLTVLHTLREVLQPDYMLSDTSCGEESYDAEKQGYPSHEPKEMIIRLKQLA